MIAPTKRPQGYELGGRAIAMMGESSEEGGGCLLIYLTSSLSQLFWGPVVEQLTWVIALSRNTSLVYFPGWEKNQKQQPAGVDRCVGAFFPRLYSRFILSKFAHRTCATQTCLRSPPFGAAPRTARPTPQFCSVPQSSGHMRPGLPVRGAGERCRWRR